MKDELAGLDEKTKNWMVEHGFPLTLRGAADAHLAIEKARMDAALAKETRAMDARAAARDKAHNEEMARIKARGDKNIRDILDKAEQKKSEAFLTAIKKADALIESLGEKPDPFKTKLDLHMIAPLMAIKEFNDYVNKELVKKGIRGGSL
ncbi:MAG: hypothetical protein LBL46_03635, partial [Rickettsiales bacterium]|nr:hypothetical protein [Rickettsiales bacterium]